MGRTETSRRGAQGRTPLTRARIVEAALRLIDERGLDALSMRTLGAELGVEAMALYRHVADKGALLDGVVELLLEELRQDVLPAQGDWREVVRSFGRGFRALAVAHPNAFPLVGRNPARSWLAAAQGVEGLLAFLRGSGFSPEDAAYAVRSVSRYAIGFSLVGTPPADSIELPPPGRYPLLDGLLHQLEGPPGAGDDDLFAFGLELQIDGLQARLDV